MNDDMTLSPEEAAAYLRVNPQTIYRNLRRGRLPGAKVGRQWRIRRTDLDRLLGGADRIAETAPAYGTVARSREEKGSARARRALLQSELKRLVRMLAERFQPRLILVYGSFVQGKVTDWSDLDLVVVAETDLPFYERSKAVLLAIRPKVGMDVVVYTPAEWEDIKTRPFVREEILTAGRVVYER